MRGGSVVRLFVLAKDATGLRGLRVFTQDETAQTCRAEESEIAFQDCGFVTTQVVGFDLQDVMQSHPAWFRIKEDS